MDLATFWDEQSKRANLGAVLDPRDQRGLKNAYLDFLHRRVLSEVLRSCAPVETILDFGCGIGRVTEWLGKATGARVIGFDRSREMISRAKAAHPRVPFTTELNAEALGAGGVVTVTVLQHILTDAELRETVATLTKSKTVRWFLVYEKTALRSHDDQHSDYAFVYQRVRSLADYEAVFGAFGFKLKVAKHNALRRHGVVVRHVIPRLNDKVGVRFLPWMCRLDRTWASVTGQGRGDADEQDSCMLFARDD